MALGRDLERRHIVVDLDRWAAWGWTARGPAARSALAWIYYPMRGQCPFRMLVHLGYGRGRHIPEANLTAVGWPLRDALDPDGRARAERARRMDGGDRDCAQCPARRHPPTRRRERARPVTHPGDRVAFVLADVVLVPDAAMRRLGDSQLADLAAIRTLLALSFPSEAHALAWSERPVPLLDGSRPRERLQRQQYGAVLAI